MAESGPDGIEPIAQVGAAVAVPAGITAKTDMVVSVIAAHAEKFIMGPPWVLNKVH